MIARKNQFQNRNISEAIIVGKISNKNVDGITAETFDSCTARQEASNPAGLDNLNFPKSINCVNEKDLNAFLKWAFEKLNKHGKQYLTTEGINAKLATYQQSSKGNSMSSESFAKLIHTYDSLCRPQSRLSSSLLRRYPLVSRHEDDDIRNEQRLRPPAQCESTAQLKRQSRPRSPCLPFQSCKEDIRAQCEAMTQIKRQSRPRSPCLPFQSCREDIRVDSSIPVDPSMADIALNGKSIMVPRRFMLQPHTAVTEPIASVPTHRKISPTYVSSFPVTGRAMIVKQLIEPRSVPPIYRVSASDIAARRAAAALAAACESERVPAPAGSAGHDDPVDVGPGHGPPVQDADPEGPSESFPLPAAVAPSRPGSRCGEPRRSVVVHVLHGGLAPDT